MRGEGGGLPPHVGLPARPPARQRPPSSTSIAAAPCACLPAAAEVVDNATRVTSVLNLTKEDASQRIAAKPLQFHFHAGSEHFVDGEPPALQ